LSIMGVPSRAHQQDCTDGFIKHARQTEELPLPSAPYE